MSSALFRMKPLDQVLGDSEAPAMRLKRALGPVQLTALGIGAIVGAGIFAAIGTAIAGDLPTGRIGAGPAVVLSLVLAAVTSAFAALCYAEFASMIPIAGSAYTYSYTTLGELIAWIIGWDLILEYAVGNVAVAISWADYFVTLLRGFDITVPVWLMTNLRDALARPQVLAAAPRLGPIPIVFNLPAAGIVALITVVLVVGVSESAWFNSVMVALKLAVVGFFIFMGLKFVRPANWHPFIPNGWPGIGAGAAIIFFAYIGFDAVSTAAEETHNPGRNLPIGIIASLVICTVLYMAIALVLTGIMPWQQLGVADPLARALAFIKADWAAGIVAFGAVVAMTSVLLVFQLGQPRIFFSMARDGLLPPWAARVHPRFRTPHMTTILTGVFVAVGAAFANIGWVVDLTNIGTLFAFILVSLGIIVLRRTDPARPRPFRTPFVPLVPLLSVLFCLYLIYELPVLTWLRFILWLAIGLAIYFVYGRSHSRLGNTESALRTED